ncbi:retrotransposon-related protein [Tanacetum coccineum]
MAPATRAIGSSNVNGDVVDDNTRRYVDDVLARIRRSMEEMLNQITPLSLQNQAVNEAVRPQTQYGRMTKVDFSKFSGEDVRGRIFRCEQFFLIDSIAEDQKVRLLSVHLFDKALLWHRQFIKVHGDNVTWPVYRDAIVQRFGTVFDDPMVDISVEHSISLYLGGLPTEIEMGVRMFKPRTLTDAYCLTNLQEATLNAVKKKSKMQFSASTSRYGSNVATNTSNPKPLLTLPNTTRTWNNKPNTAPPRKQLTQKEYEDKRVKNLCFYCDKKFVPGHKCEGQLFSLVVLGENEEEEEFVDADDSLEEIGSEEVQPQISLNALHGMSSFQTLRVHQKNMSLVNCLGRDNCSSGNWEETAECHGWNHTSRVIHDVCLSKHWLIFDECKAQQSGVCEGNQECVKVPELSVVVEEFSDVFALSTELPPKRTHDHRIPLLEGVPPVNIRPYRHPPIQKDAIEAMLIDELHAAVIFSKLDLMSGYHQIRMFEDDIAKTAFRTHEGHYEFLVMPFGLTNAPSTFQALMNDVFKAYLRKFTLMTNQLFAKKSKCVFGTSHVEYLGHVISAQGVATDPSKIVAMQDWLVPTNIKQLRGFLGLTGYYRKFIKDFAKAMTKAPVLALPDFTIPFEIETNASGMDSTYEKEFLAVIMALEKWRGYLLDRHFIIKTDHYSLKYLLGITTPAQMKWLPKLMGFDYEVNYKKGVENAAADALSRVQNEGHLMAAMVVSIPTEFITRIEASWHTDDTLQPILSKLQGGQQAKKHYTSSNGQLLRKNKLVVGHDDQLKLELLTYFHASSVGGHSRVKVTTYKLCSFVYWKGMRKEVKKFVKECITCQWCKRDLAAYPGLLQPLPIPDRIWDSISMDCIEGLPKSKGFNVIFVVVDRLTKYAHFMPLSHPFSAMQVAQLAIPGYNGQTEVVNSLECYLRCMTGERPQDWAKWLSLAELWYHSNFHTSIHTTPFQAVYGQTPPIHVPYLGGLSKVDAVDRTLEAREQAIQIMQRDSSNFTSLFIARCGKDGLLAVEPIVILDRKMIKKRNAVEVYGLIQWTNGTIEDATWEPLA